jgi:hypothetical protein
VISFIVSLFVCSLLLCIFFYDSCVFSVFGLLSVGEEEHHSGLQVILSIILPTQIGLSDGSENQLFIWCAILSFTVALQVTLK